MWLGKAHLENLPILTSAQRVGVPGDSLVNNPPASTGDMGSIPGSGRSPGEGNGNPLQYSCLENPMDRGAWQAIVHEVAKGQTWLNKQHIHRGASSDPFLRESFIFKENGKRGWKKKKERPEVPDQFWLFNSCQGHTGLRHRLFCFGPAHLRGR